MAISAAKKALRLRDQEGTFFFWRVSACMTHSTSPCPSVLKSLDASFTESV